MFMKKACLCTTSYSTVASYAHIHLVTERVEQRSTQSYYDHPAGRTKAGSRGSAHSLDDSAVPIAYSLTMPAALDLVTVPRTLMQQLLVAV